MRFDILTCVPELLQGPFAHSIVGRAQEKGKAEIVVHNLRDYAEGRHRPVDDYAFGGGAGMVLMIEPIARCIEHLQTQRKYDEVIYLSPDGLTFHQGMANQLSLQKNFILLCGHYKGVDERVRTHFVSLEISIGDYVLSGGELAAAVVVDALVRLLPGVLSDETSALTDSFQDNLLAPPVYTRPAEWRGLKVPDVLLSGDHSRIEAWREVQAWERTQHRRPDLLKGLDT
ncbi:MAG: tRNA (guanosine(37)-N1)-methyltransferase TrmD [Microscillaceae bacterium]|nr:tRNA (guanosine(37)-N1)-methyltransferase TrmD [Microscillaceae bacterium]